MSTNSSTHGPAYLPTVPLYFHTTFHLHSNHEEDIITSNVQVYTCSQYSNTALDNGKVINLFKCIDTYEITLASDVI